MNYFATVSMQTTVDGMLTSAEHNGEARAHAAVLYYNNTCIMPDLRALDSTFPSKFIKI